MRIEKLDHVNLRTQQLDTMVDWYARVLDLKPGARPDFPFSGAWLYAGNAAVIHLVETETAPGAGSEADLKLEHFALRATGRDAFETKLKELGESFQSNEISDVGIVQYNVWDPDGNHIHIDFPTSE